MAGARAVVGYARAGAGAHGGGGRRRRAGPTRARGTKTDARAAAGQTAKKQRAYVCEECGWDTLQWVGKCGSCGAWNSLKEVVGAATTARTAHAAASRRGWVADAPDAAPRSLAAVARSAQADGGAAARRLQLDGAVGEELARVLGGGVVPGSLTLVGGEPGVGKSTLLLQLAALLTAHNKPVLYVSGEESVEQICGRASRLPTLASVPNADEMLMVHATTSVDDVIERALALDPAALVVDSIQTVYLDGVSGAAGSVTQVRECAASLLRVAKDHSIPVLLVGHVTKAGEIAGPRVLEHIVDAVLYLENDASGGPGRVLRALKNRFGPTDELGLFAMTPRGMEALADASLAFGGQGSDASGPAAVAASVEGSRAVLVEVQALANAVPKEVNGAARRVGTGVDTNRLHMLLAILSKSAGVRAYGFEVYVNVSGGLRVTDPAADLAVCVAVAASMRGKRVAPGVAFAAEVGLGGDLRGCAQLSRRLGEARRMGFTQVVVASGSASSAPASQPGLAVVPVRTLAAALAHALV